MEGLIRVQADQFLACLRLGQEHSPGALVERRGGHERPDLREDGIGELPGGRCCGGRCERSSYAARMRVVRLRTAMSTQPISGTVAAGPCTGAVR
jgi:hypothetical protein